MRAGLFKFSVTAAALTTLLGVAGGPLATEAGASQGSVAVKALQWAAQDEVGNVRLAGDVPLAITSAANLAAAGDKLVGTASKTDTISLNFAFPLRNKDGLNALIVEEARTHRQLSRAKIYADFSPPVAQYAALRTWLKAEGFVITHVASDRLEMTARATTSVIEKALSVKINVYKAPAAVDDGVKVPAQDFYSNTTSPVVPARFGLQSISGLSNIDSPLFFTDLQLSAAGAPATATTAKGAEVVTHVRSGGYYPRDLRSMYDVQDTANYGTGQTTGYTLWGAGEVQAAATAFASATGETALTVDTPCTASSNSPTSPSSCATVQEAPNHLLNILENGNTNTNFGGNDETGLDVEVSHGMAPGDAEKYYLGDCSTTPSPGTVNGNSCNGSDVGLEDAIEDAANDPTLHSVSNSWAYGGDAEYGAADPFVEATTNSFAIAAAAGTTFYFSSGDTGTYEAGYPSDSPYVVSVGGTTLFSTTAVTGSATATLSSEDLWAAGGSWCSNVEARPSWQTGTGVADNATCPGRAMPDVVAIADTNSEVYECYSKSATTDGCGGVGGTSVAAPVMNGMEADTENYIDAQTYPGATPSIGFEGPVMYMLGNSGNENDYYRDVLCGNDADPTGSPDGESALPGWDEASGWGAIDWQHYSTGYAIELGATGLSTPSSLSQNYPWTCVKTPGNSTEHGISFPTVSDGYAVGTDSSAPWYSTYLPSSSWGASNTFYQTTDGGTQWVPSNADLMGVACTSSTDCVEVGDGGVIKYTTNAGTTWTPEATEFDQALTQVTCPSSTICFAAGDRGTILQSSNGGLSFVYSTSVDGNPIYGLTCPSTTVCYAVDNYGHVETTTNGGASWTMQTTPITTPAVNVPGSGGPTPDAGLFGVSCTSTTSCVSVGQDPPSGETTPPLVETSNGGSTWTLDTSVTGETYTPTAETSTTITLTAAQAKTITTAMTVVGAGITNGTVSSVNTTTGVVTLAGTITTLTSTPYSFTELDLQNTDCVAGTTTCFAVGDFGTIYTTTNLSTWTSMTSNTTEALTGITCLSTTYCVATGQAGTVDVYNGTSWTVTSWSVTPVGSSTSSTAFLAGVTCVTENECFAVGHEGVTLGFDSTNVAGTVTQLAGGGYAGTVDAISCASATTCVAVGASGTILQTTNGGQTWTFEYSGVTVTLDGVSCNGSTCVAVGTSGDIIGSSNGGSTWSSQTSGVTVALDAVSCTSTTCVVTGAVTGATGTDGTILTSPIGSGTWTSRTDTSAAALDGVTCVGTDCYAVGAIPSGTTAAAIQASTNSGATWTAQTSNVDEALSSIACVDAQDCFAGGAIGTVMATNNGGATWYQEGDPISGPLSALNTTGPTSITAIDGAACSADACFMATGSSGNIMMTPELSVTVTATSAYGATPQLTSLSPSNGAISYSVPSEASNVTGTLTCSTSATAASVPGSYSISSCSGLSASGYNVIYNYAGSSYTVTQAAQAITFTSTAPTGDVVGDTYTVTATGGGSGNAVTFAIDGSSTSGCTIDDSGDVTFSGPAGTCVIDANEAGSTDYSAAPQAVQDIAVGLISQSISFTSTAPSSPVVGDSYTVTATGGGSGNAVTFAIDGSSTSGCTIDDSGDVTFSGPAGTCVIDADQAGTTSYAAASEVSQSISVGLAPQTITFTSTAPTGAVVGDTYDATATGGASGNPIVFSIDASSTSGCTVDGDTGVVDFAGPAGTCVVDADQAGNDSYNAAGEQSQAIVVGTDTQVITFTSTPPNDPIVGDTYDATATGGGSGNPIVFSIDASSTSGCTVDAETGVVTFDGPAGTCELDANQAGDGDYSAAVQSSQSMTSGKDSQTITFTSTAPTGDVVGDTYTVTATGGGSGNAVTFTIDGSSTSGCTIDDSGDVTFSGPAGTCVIDADQAGDGSYSAAGEVDQAITVGTDAQSITFTSTAPTGAVVGDTYDATATGGGSGNAVTFTIDGSSTSGCTVDDSGDVTFSGPAGICIIDANQAGDGSYAPAGQASQSIAVGKDVQTLEFTSTAPTSAVVGGSYAATATGGASGNPIVFSVGGSSTSGCVVNASSGVVTFTGPAGSCVVDVNQAGNASFDAATSVSQSFTIAKARASLHIAAVAPKTGPVTFTATVSGVSGTAPTGTVTVLIGASTCRITALSGAGTGSCSISEPAGTYAVGAIYSGSASYLGTSTTASVVVAKATPAVKVTYKPTSPKKGDVTYTVTVSGAAGIVPTGSVTVSDGSKSCTIKKLSSGTGSCKLDQGAGSYTVVATYHGDKNYVVATGSVKVTVKK